MRTCRIAVAAGLLAMLIAGVGLGVRHGTASAASPADFCIPVPDEARVPAGVDANEQFSVTVPFEIPSDPLSSRVLTARQDDVIEYKVFSLRPGAIAVHGLLDPIPVEVGGRTTVAFKAIYSGRFPLHFHGADGSHFELAGLNVMSSAHPNR
jgi:hypothetical protein